MVVTGFDASFFLGIFETKAARDEATLVVWQQPTCRFSLGDMAPVQAARGSSRQGSIEPEDMMIKHEIQAAAREEPHW